MVACLYRERMLANLQTPQLIQHDVRTNLKFIRAVVGVFDIDLRERRPDDHFEGIGKILIETVSCHVLKGIFFVKQNHAVLIVVVNVIKELAFTRHILIGMQHGSEFVIRVRIIEMKFLCARAANDAHESFSGKSSRRIVPLIPLEPRKISACMVLFATRKIFHAEAIFDGDDNAPARRQMPHEHIDKGLKGMLAADVLLRIFENANQQNIVIISVQSRFYIAKVADMNRDIIRFTVTIGIDETAFLGEFHAVNNDFLFSKRRRDGTTAGTHLQNAGTFCHGNPFDNIAPLFR